VKLEAYARAGVPAYASVDPATRTLRHYRLEAPGRYADPHVHGAAEVVSVDCLPTIRIPVGELVAGAPDTTL
jgi:Uma2 family endonuclease